MRLGCNVCIQDEQSVRKKSLIGKPNQRLTYLAKKGLAHYTRYLQSL
jgi:hypothetical protein